ncbi:MAG: hypothetical protein ACTHU0_01430 [Kofleriaceae bacterium]
MRGVRVVGSARGTWQAGGVPWATDPTSGKGVPASSVEWLALLSSAGIASAAPSSLWLCQEAAGGLTDSIGSVALSVAGAGHLYQQPVAGWSRLAVRTTDGTANQRWVNTATAPNPGLRSVLLLAYIDLPAAAPASTRDLMAVSATGDVRLLATRQVRAIQGSTVDTTSAHAGVQLIALKINRAAGESKLYTPSEKLVLTYASPVSAMLLALGGQTATAAAAGYLYAAQFADAGAELTDPQVKAIYQALGYAPPWS